MFFSSSRQVCTGRTRRSRSVNSLPESWKTFYEADGAVIGRGGAGKVLCVRRICNDIETPMTAVTAVASGRFELTGGRFGQICEIINEPPLGKLLALKSIRRIRFGRDSIDRIINEIQIMKRLQSPRGNFSRPDGIEDFAPDSACPFLISVHQDPTEVAIVMEFALGGSLFDLCRSEGKRQGLTFLESPQSSPSLPGLMSKPPIYPNRRSGPSIFQQKHQLPEDYIRIIIEKVSTALQFMHEKANIVHLDIKAENILLREPYPSTNIFITDFGLASFITQSKPHKELAGTPDYTAPEVISYDPVSFQTDMWSVGVLAYFMLTGVSPFLSETKELTQSNIIQMKIDYPQSLFADTSPAAVNFIQSLIRKRPTDRLSAAQCLTHDWLLQKNSSELDDAIPMDNIRFTFVENDVPPESFENHPDLEGAVHVSSPNPILYSQLVEKSFPTEKMNSTFASPLENFSPHEVTTTQLRKRSALTEKNENIQANERISPSSTLALPASKSLCLSKPSNHLPSKRKHPQKCHSLVKKSTLRPRGYSESRSKVYPPVGLAFLTGPIGQRSSRCSAFPGTILSTSLPLRKTVESSCEIPGPPSL